MTVYYESKIPHPLNPKKMIHQSFDQFVQKHFKIICKACGSDNVHLNYEEEGGYSEYTQWGSSFSMGCNACQQNDIYK